MSDYIRAEGLLEGEEIDRLEQTAPKAIIDRNTAHAQGFKVASWNEFFDEIGIER